MIKLYDSATNSNSRKIHAIARDCDVTLEMMPVDLMQGDGQKPEFLSINPNGKIPAMVDDGLKLFESNAIMCYIAAKHQSPLLPKDASGRAQVDQWLFWQTAHLSAATGKVAWERLYKKYRNLGEPDQARVEEGLAELDRYLTVLDGVLAKSPYVCGSSLTVADYAICSTLAKAPRERLQIENEILKHPHVKKWLGVVESRPSWMHA